MPPSSPPQQNVVRRFAPEPIETTSKSSKQARKHSPDKQNQEHEPPKIRRFAPEPIETSSKSSRKPAASPEEDSKPAVRRFAPEPIETSKKSSKDKASSNGQDQGSSDSKPAVRRFAPEPVETSKKSSKDKASSNDQNQGSTSHITKFKPQLVETSFGSNRSSRSSSRRTSQHSDVASRKPTEDAVPRRFQPEVLGTAKRSRRNGDANDVNYQDYKTEEGFVVHAREHQRHVRRKAKANRKAMGDGSQSSSRLEIPPEMRRSIAPLDGSAPPRPDMEPERSHSFRCPELDTIDSSESEHESGHSSRRSVSPGQGSPITASDSSYPQAFYKHATRMRESVDESFSHYLMQLEQKKALRRREEAALAAAFPNSDYHEPVHHYVNSEQDGSEEMEIEDRPVTWEGFDDDEFLQRAALRRESTSTVSWEQLELQRHAEQLEQDRLANKVTEKKKESHSPWWNPVTGVMVHEPQVSELKSMRDRARPPMLGNDLKFPRCPSPEPARFDVTQGSEALRKQMCYLSEQSTAETSSSKGGLWAAKAPVKKSEKSVSSAASKAKSTAGKGLWGGFCVSNEDTTSNAALSPPAGPTGLMTPAPRLQNSNPFEQSFAARNGAAVSVAPPTPPDSVDLNRLDAMLMSESQMVAQIEREYPDSFVTQVYNYLSLGYPSLARPFDEELAKISSIPISELREDDVKAKQSPRGYIRLGTDFEGGGGQGVSPQDCKRWQALKLYVLEWAKQEKNFDKTAALTERGNWATTQRRGSWAI